MSFRFTFDPNRCTGCQACVVGCWMEHRQQGQPWRQVHTFNGFRHPALPVIHLSSACHHCADPACLRHCPADAYTKDAATGAVTVDAERCMGCRYCTWACPFDAPKFNERLGTIEKCTFCPERTGRGDEPACVARCPVEALGFEEIFTTETQRARREEDGEPKVPGFPNSDLDPSIRFVALRQESGPELGFAPEPALLARFLDQVLALPERKITLRGEWTLLVFTTVMTVLSGWFIAAMIGGPALPPWVFLGLGLPAMGLSAWHLGRKERAWRALLHMRTSWLSREILLTSAFMGLGALSLLVFPQHKPLAWATAFAGFTGLMAIDRIYRVALGGKRRLHSAQTLLNGHYLMGILGGLPILSIGAGLLKAGLYTHRKVRFHRLDRPWRPGLSALRIGLGFLLPALLAPWNPAAAALCAVLGDLIDRCEFYDELEVVTPQGEMVYRAAQRLAQS